MGGKKMRVLENGIYREMTEEEITELKEQAEQFVENIKPSVETEIAELKEKLEKLRELFSPLLKMIGSNK